MPRRLVVLALLLLPLAYVPAQATAMLGEGAGPARHPFRPAILPVSQLLPPQLSILDTCADGTLAHDETGGAAGVVLPNLQVQLWDRDSASADDLLDADLTDAAGGFTVCASIDDLDDTANDGLDLYVRAVTENGFWRVQDTEPYRFDLPVSNNVPSGTTIHYGLSKPDSGAFQIFNAMDRFYAWTAAQHVNDCWDALDHKPPDDYSKCRQVVIDWRPDSATQTFYDSALNKVYLNGDDFKWRDAVVRTAAKAVMDDVFDDDFPDTQDCGDGTKIGKQTTQNCAWVNGFADWVATQVFADPVLDFQVGTVVFHENLETPDWDTVGWDRGDAVEGRVAGALLDISDAVNETPWDRVAQGPNHIWSKLLTNYSWTQRFRTLSELNFVGDSALATLYQNTIDYGLRDPLTNGTVYVRRTPEPAQNFRYTTTVQSWSVMAIRPPVGVDYDLKLYATVDMLGIPLASSTFGSGVADFVVIDSNFGKRALGTFYPQVYQYSGTGNYDLKYVQATSTFSVGQTVSAFMPAGNPVAIWETFVGPSASVQLELNQPLGTNGELFLFCDTSSSSTWVRGRPLATATAPSAGGTETLVWTAPSTAPGDCAVVLVNKSGSGTYTVFRKS
ncbi:MAG TPA: hypothetical protein VFC19_11180 [Candidatus Limnocylindrales bacterium]|nr:hypothetical protein [Candidatus Limnocylindrales bacterium]